MRIRPRWRTYALIAAAAVVATSAFPAIAQRNQAPIAGFNWSGFWEDGSYISTVLNNDFDPNGDQISVVGFDEPDNLTVTIDSQDRLVIVPDENWHGYESFNYYITDGSVTVAGLQRVRVWSVNDSPEAYLDNSDVDAGDVVMVDASDNDIDPDDEDLTIVSVSQPTSGTASIVGNMVRFVAPGSARTVTMSYTVSDGQMTDTAEVIIAVEGGGEEPPPPPPPPPPPGGGSIDYGVLEPGPGAGERASLTSGYNTAGALDFSEDGEFFVVQQTAGSWPHGTLFHFLGDFDSWDEKFDAVPRPSVYQSLFTHNGENVALEPDGSKVYVAGEGSPGSSWGKVYSYDIDYHTDHEVSTTDGAKTQFEYNAAGLTGVNDGLSGMFVSRKNPGIHWFVVDHTWAAADAGGGDKYVLFAIDAVNDKLVYRGSFDIGDGEAIANWGDVEDLTGYVDDGVWYLEIWDNGKDSVYRFPEPSLSVGQSLTSKKGLSPNRVVNLNGVGTIVASGNVEAMAWNPADGAMYWIGPRGTDSDKNNNLRNVIRIDNWADVGSSGGPAITVGKIVNRPQSGSVAAAYP